MTDFVGLCLCERSSMTDFVPSFNSGLGSLDNGGARGCLTNTMQPATWIYLSYDQTKFYRYLIFTSDSLGYFGIWVVLRCRAFISMDLPEVSAATSGLSPQHTLYYIVQEQISLSRSVKRYAQEQRRSLHTVFCDCFNTSIAKYYAKTWSCYQKCLSRY